MKKKVIFPLLITTFMLASCGKQPAADSHADIQQTVETATAAKESTETPTTDSQEDKEENAVADISETSSGDDEKTEREHTPLNIKDGVIIFPDGRQAEMTDDRQSEWDLGSLNDIPSYSVKGLEESFESLDVSFTYNGETYNFKCQVKYDPENHELTWENVETNLPSSMSDEYGESYWLESTNRHTNIGVMRDNRTARIYDIYEMDNLMVNGVPYIPSSYFKEAKDSIGVEPVSDIEYTDYDNNWLVTVRDYWCDASDNRMKVYLQYFEAEDYEDIFEFTKDDWKLRGATLHIGY